MSVHITDFGPLQ